MRLLRYKLAGLLILATLGANTAPLAAPAVDRLYLYASQAGKPTFDQGEGGGNPFAGALVELLGRDSLAFETFGAELVRLTLLKSNGLQQPDLPDRVDLKAWQFLPKPEAEKRVALVLVYSDYSAAGAAQSLPGAQRDMDRVAGALEKAGFEVWRLLDPDRVKLITALKGFAACSAGSEVALLYTTGHGAEVAGTVYLLPGDYPFSRGVAALKMRALRLTVLGSALRAKRVNLIFYGGCRDNPFGG